MAKFNMYLTAVTTATSSLILSAGIASAATLTGDTVTKVVTNNSVNVGFDENMLIGAGIDADDGNIFFDLDAGAGNQLSITVGDGSYCGMYDCSGLTEVVFSSMDFSGAELLLGFNVLNAGPLGIVATVLSGTSLKISWTEGSLSGGTFTLGEYVTGTSEVPLPAALPLMLAGLGALGGLAARRRKAA